VRERIEVRVTNKNQDAEQQRNPHPALSLERARILKLQFH